MMPKAFATIRDFWVVHKLLDGMVNVGLEESAKLVMRSKTSFFVILTCLSLSFDINWLRSIPDTSFPMSLGSSYRERLAMSLVLVSKHSKAAETANFSSGSEMPTNSDDEWFLRKITAVANCLTVGRMSLEVSRRFF